MKRTYRQALSLIHKVDCPVGTEGYHSIERFDIDEPGANLHNLRCALKGIGHRAVRPGTYTRLVRKGTFDPVMSDTDAERHDHVPAIQHAAGHCLIAGLGIGMVAEACLRAPGVDYVTVVEMEPDVIKLSGLHLLERYENLEIIQSNIFDYKPRPGQHFGMAWFDIWDDLCIDHLPEMATLSRKFTRRCDWYGHWARDEIRRHG